MDESIGAYPVGKQSSADMRRFRRGIPNNAGHGAHREMNGLPVEAHDAKR